MLLVLIDIFLSFKCQNYTAKLSDFGLAKDGPTGDKSHVSTRVMGTYGYAAPEYLATGMTQCRGVNVFDLAGTLSIQLLPVL